MQVEIDDAQAMLVLRLGGVGAAMRLVLRCQRVGSAEFDEI
tara:strand:+ start:323 stop:445 length:123 start_codon:yes stop_codon:yes gene_type:complete